MKYNNVNQELAQLKKNPASTNHLKLIEELQQQLIIVAKKNEGLESRERTVKAQHAKVISGMQMEMTGTFLFDFYFFIHFLHIIP